MADEQTPAPTDSGSETGTVENAAEQIGLLGSQDEPKAKPALEGNEAVEEDEATDEEPADEEVEETTEKSGEEEEEAVDENADEESAEESEENETEEAEEPMLYTVTVDGQKSEVTLEELQSGFMMNKDYSQKTMALSEERKSLKNEQETFNQTSQQSAEAAQQQLNRLAGLVRNVMGAVPSEAELLALREKDPDAYLHAKEEIRGKQELVYRIDQEAKLIRQQREKEDSESFASTVAEEKEKLLAKLPEWADEAKAKEGMSAVAKYLEGEGFSTDELNGLVDHRTLLIARKAYLYDLGVKNKQGLAKKKVSKVVKVQKPGTSKKAADSKKTERQRLFQRAKKAGTAESAAEAIAALG